MGIDKKEHFVKTPEYLGGVKGLQQFIKENLQYPKEAFENKIEATVHVKYVVDNKGNVIEAKCVGTTGYGLEEEAIRVVRLLKYSSVNNRKMRVTFNKKIDIHFRMPKLIENEIEIQAPAPVELNVLYTLTPETKSPNKVNEPKSSNFEYQIKW